MRKHFYLLIGCLLMSGFLAGQSLVVTSPQYRNVVLEEFTGIHCGYCPDGHARAQALADANPGRVVLINVHAGGYAVPSTGEPDFRTAFGEALVTYMGVDGYPSGAVNRHLFANLGTSISMSRSAWAWAATQILPLQSPVNAGFKSTFDASSRVLTVETELFYTASSPASTNYIQVALLENHVFGYQSDYANGTQTNYDHKHILRHFLTGQWGDPVTTTTQGSLVTRTYTFTVPAEWNMANCDVAVYVTEGQGEVYTGGQAIADGGTNDGATAIFIGNLPEPTANVSHGTETNPSVFSTQATSSLSGTESFEFALEHNAPAEWLSGFSVNGQNFGSTGTVDLNQGVAANVQISVTPQTTPGLAVYSLRMKSLTFPTAPEKVIRLHVIYGVNTLIAEGSGGWGNGENYDFGAQFDQGLSAAGCTTWGHTTADIMEKGFSSGAFSEVEHLFMNVGWRFPSFSDPEATAIMSFLDNGGNLFVAGQDLGWDINDANGYGTTVTKNLYTNYLHAAFVNDGSTTNNQLNANPSDSLFAQAPTSAITDQYANNMYPDQINPLSGALPIFYYNTGTTKVAGIRYTNGVYKIVYLGVDLAMIAQEPTRNFILETSYDWFTSSGIGFETPLHSGIRAYPNPCSEFLYIEIPENQNENWNIELFNLQGQKLFNVNSGLQTSTIEIPTGNFPAGSYMLKMTNNSGHFVYPVQVTK